MEHWRAIRALIDSGQAERALSAGDTAPDFELEDANGNSVSSRKLVAEGTLVLTFYRGVCCPYCNYDLQALEDVRTLIEDRGARLVAISPQTLANSRESQRDNKLGFPILSDAGAHVADRFGLRFELPADLIEVYKQFGNDLPMINANPQWVLPMPARYVIGANGVIAYAEVNPDYTHRPDRPSCCRYLISSAMIGRHRPGRKHRVLPLAGARLSSLLKIPKLRRFYPMPIKIYGDPGSDSLRRVTSAAAIMGTAIERVNVDLFKGESRTPEFLALNPHGLTPVMVDDETVLYEASAINIYLAEKAGSDLLGANDQERHQVLQWMFWSGEQWRVFSVLQFNERVGNRFLGEAENKSIVDLALKNIRAAAAVLDAHLADRRFIVGDHLTFAGIDIAAPFSQVTRNHPPFAEFGHLAAWQQRLLDTVPAWAATKQEVDVRMDAALAAAGIEL
ncbi:redoxin domain-containing protein [Bradyrhizobium sp. WSM3983]|uniref:redoxin domain-containing protein n=1 Tax=Bradyrhizobium sp. WSM3983 TaxID=1038867 RepID=UPI00041FEF52|nr:redoxin domain-containing protein [Bradyrhizobium sp. WSM3983]